MSSPKLLSIYLRDHHAMSVAAIELAQRMMKSNAGNAFGETAEYLAAEIPDDRRRLEEVMTALDISPSRVKEAGAWVGEKLGRLKPSGRAVSYSPLSRVLEFEVFASMLCGQLRLWQALRIARQADQRLAEFDFDECTERAKEQLERVESMHRQAVEVAFLEA